MIENIGAPGVSFNAAELADLNGSLAAIEIKGARLPDAVQAFSDVEAPARS
jgi:hypothetical protein